MVTTTSSPRRPSLRQRLFGERARHIALIGFIAAVFMMGGASRHDVLSWVLLRPIAFAAIAYAVVAAPPGRLRALPFPFYLLVALACLIALQLVPLPPTIWGGLPERDIVVRIAADAGLAERWRPFSLTPSRTWNSLFALSIPFAAFLLYAAASDRSRRVVIPALVVGAAASAILGLVQLVGGDGSAAYLYRVHTAGEAVGLFANRNHQGVFLACTIVLIAILGSRVERIEGSSLLRITMLGGFLVALIPFLLVLGSRAGLLLGIVALPIAFVLLLRSPLLKAGSLRGRKLPASRWLAPKLLLGAAFAAVVAGLVVIATLNSRDQSLMRLSDSGKANAFDRDAVFPYLVRMTQDYFPWGSGFGSFDTVFHRYEPRSGLSTTYLNQAHNDWFQVVIEGGLIGAAILGLFVAWWLARAIWAVRRRKADDAPLRLGLVALIAFIGVASIVDYPARVPIVMMFLALAVSMLPDHQLGRALRVPEGRKRANSSVSDRRFRETGS